MCTRTPERRGGKIPNETGENEQAKVPKPRKVLQGKELQAWIIDRGFDGKTTRVQREKAKNGTDRIGANEYGSVYERHKQYWCARGNISKYITTWERQAWKSEIEQRVICRSTHNF